VPDGQHPRLANATRIRADQPLADYSHCGARLRPVEFPHRSRFASHASAIMKPSFTTVASPTRRRALARAWTGVSVMRRVGVRDIAGALDSILH
jgi:hypothetical protein